MKTTPSMRLTMKNIFFPFFIHSSHKIEIVGKGVNIAEAILFNSQISRKKNQYALTFVVFSSVIMF